MVMSESKAGLDPADGERRPMKVYLLMEYLDHADETMPVEIFESAADAEQVEDYLETYAGQQERSYWVLPFTLR